MSVDQKIRGLLDRFDPLPLECDGFTRVAAYLLGVAEIPYRVVRGDLGRIPHFWLETEDGGWIVDYRARMWCGALAHVAHGVFQRRESSVEYKGEVISIEVNRTIYELLTGDVTKYLVVRVMVDGLTRNVLQSDTDFGICCTAADRQATLDEPAVVIDCDGNWLYVGQEKRSGPRKEKSAAVGVG